MNILKSIKIRLYKYARRKYLKVDSERHNVRKMGNEYGGFSICDDGYNSRQLIVYSFGIGEDLSFSENVMREYDAKIYAFDPTPRAVAYVKKHALFQNKKFSFEAIGLSDKNEVVKFHLPRNEAYVSGSAIAHEDVKEVGIDVRMENLSTIASRYGHEHIDLLKLDIEGSEFRVVEQFGTMPIQIDQICIEIHDRYFDNGLERLCSLFSAMHSLGYSLIHISKSEEEFTFIKG